MRCSGWRKRAAGPCPDTDWSELLRQDLDATHSGSTPGVSAGSRYRYLTFPSGRTLRWWVVIHNELDAVFLLDVSAYQRLQQAGQAMLADLSHELRTPIATLLTHLEIMGLADLDDGVRRRSWELARREAQRMGCGSYLRTTSSGNVLGN